MTKTKLAAAVGVSPRLISMYEHGDIDPPEKSRKRLTEALRFPESFFFGDDLHEPTVDGVSFRGLASMTSGQRDMSLATGSLAMEIDRWISERFRLPLPDLPCMRGFQPEEAADALRTHWGLGEKPCPNMVHILEVHGVRVFSLPRDSKSVHAFSFWCEREPFVFLTTDTSGEKGRFDAAHELAHLLMHRDGRIKGRAAELEADRFASAFLMPRASVLEHVPIAPFIDNLIRLKRVWRVAAMALVHRVHALGLITDWQYRSLCIEGTQRGFRKSEPDGIDRERSQVLDKVFGALRSEGLSRSAIANEMALRVADLNALTFGPALQPDGGSPTDRHHPPRNGKKPRLRLL